MDIIVIKQDGYGEIENADAVITFRLKEGRILTNSWGLEGINRKDLLKAVDSNYFQVEFKNFISVKENHNA